MKIDLHCHTEASGDCLTPLTEFPARCRAQGIQVQAITDHDAVWGAQKLQELVAAEADADEPLTVIVGEEVTTQEGEIIGLFLNEKVPPGLPAAEAVAQIKRQGGLVLLPHGFDPYKRGRLRSAALQEVADKIDIVETFNARVSFQRFNRQAQDWAERRGLVQSAGTDAHRLADVGVAWVEAPERPIHHPADLLAALEAGEVIGSWTHPVLAYLKKQIAHWKHRMMHL
ncbi:MAG: PHP domain-containing protein [Anaerolineales bacterium]|nr:PHP domain-containing protein [Anaerolineales bacterium]